ncbi:MAG TPA: hypothetical protein PKU69_00370 [Bacillota bacterium]|nr:hypothetical protein [Bacillota bacterium]
MKEYVKLIDGLPFIVRVILAFPFLDGIVYGIYRIAKGRLIAGIVWIFLGIALFWILDLYTLFTKGKVTILT